MNNFSCPYLHENVLKMVKCFWSQQEFVFFFRFRSEICLNHPEKCMINENEVKNRNWKKKQISSVIRSHASLCLDKQKPKP